LSGSVPIRNIFVMFAYASREMGLLDDRAIGACDFERPLDLVGRLFDASLRRLHRRGLDRQYQTLEESGLRPRGALNVSRTLNRLLHVRGELAWTVDELLPNTPCNRLLKAALRRLLQRETVEPEVRKRLRAHIALLSDVEEISPRKAVQLSVQVPRAIPEYHSAVLLSRLVLEHLLPDGGAGGKHSKDLQESPTRMGDLFEKFVRGFAEHEFRGAAVVKPRNHEWHAKPRGDTDLSLLPQLKTDVSIDWESGESTIVECKFYKDPLVHGPYSSQGKIRARHLHQLLGYLRARDRSAGPRPRGLLLYAMVDDSLHASWELDGYELSVAALDLTAEWGSIRKQLLTLM
jgi:5-methylcytosine-specific restriction enzyme subunit McrC